MATLGLSLLVYKNKVLEKYVFQVYFQRWVLFTVFPLLVFVKALLNNSLWPLVQSNVQVSPEIAP